MSPTVEQPQFSRESLRLLNRFQESLRTRIYNHLEDRALETSNNTITPADMETCILQAIEDYRQKHNPGLL